MQALVQRDPAQAIQVLERANQLSPMKPEIVLPLAQSLIAGGQEVEENAGLAVGLYALPGAELKGFHFTQEQVEEANGPGYWRLETGLEPDQTNGWLVFIDPFHLDSEGWLKSWNEAYAPLPVLGADGKLKGMLSRRTLLAHLLAEAGS